MKRQRLATFLCFAAAWGALPVWAQVPIQQPSPQQVVGQQAQNSPYPQPNQSAYYMSMPGQTLTNQPAVYDTSIHHGGIQPVTGQAMPPYAGVPTAPQPNSSFPPSQWPQTQPPTSHTHAYQQVPLQQYTPSLPQSPILPPGYRPTSGFEPLQPTQELPTAPAPLPMQGSPRFVPLQPQPMTRTAEQITYKLKTLTSAEFEKKLLDTFSKRFIPLEKTATSGREKPQSLGHYRLPVKDGSLLELTLDRQSRVVTLSGTRQAVTAARQILQHLDTHESPDAQPRTEITTYHPGIYKAVAQTVDVLETELAQVIPGPGGNMNMPPNSRNLIQWRGNNAPGAAPEEQQEAVGNDIPEGVIDPGAMAAIQGMQGAGLIGPIQVQVLDELGTIIVRGNKKDVAIVLEMIRQIEAVSMEHEPEISIFRMQQADAARVAEIVRSLYNQIYLARRGMVSITALGKPNVILLIGQKESVETASMLIEKLDMEVPPNDQFVVVRLRNASSDMLKMQLDEFYARSGTLSATVLITSDTRTNTLILQGSPRDLAEVTTLIRQMDAPGGEAVNNVRVFHLKNALASELATTLQSAITGSSTGGGGMNMSMQGMQSTNSRNPVLEMLAVDPKAGTAVRSGVLSDVRVTADSRSNSLIVNAPPETMPLVETLIMQLDKLPTAEAQIKVFEIINADASSLTTMLQNLFSSSSSSGAGGGGQFGQTGGSNSFATTRTGTSPNDSTLVGLRFQAEIRSNSIVAIGSPSDLDLVDALLLRLDDENMHNRQVVVYRLLNTAAADVQTAISQYVTQEMQTENQTIGTYEPVSPLEQYRKNVVVVAEPITNTLIVSTTPRYYERIREIIRHLDERPPMVFIQVLIAEVVLNHGCDFGTELGLQDAILFQRSDPTSGLPGFDFIKNPLGNNAGATDNSLIGSQGITNLGLNRTNANKNGGFVFSASSESVSILIRALEEKKKVQVLSSPTMLTLDNMQAQLLVGERVRFITNTNMNNDTISNSTEPEDVGIILDVTPRITPDNMVVMKIYTERSKIGPEEEGTVIGIQGNQQIRSPRIEKTMLQTTVSTMTGQTTVLGGLIHEEKSVTEVGVPVLNRIPVLKYAFSYSSKSSQRKELVIIMTPTVIRDEFDLELLKQQELARMNWCVSDVTRIGRSNVRGRCDAWYAGETEVIPMMAPVAPTRDMLPNEKEIGRQLPHAVVPAAPKLAPERGE